LDFADLGRPFENVLMRARLILLLGVVLAGGCLVPSYGVAPGESGGAASTGGSTSGSSGSNGSGGTEVSGGSAATGGSAGTTAGASSGCGAGKKLCEGECVDIDDVEYGCTATSCNKSACPAPGEGTLSCQGGECVVGGCKANYKKCGDVCVAINDPGFGCGDTTCSNEACPVPGEGDTLVCEGSSCVIGQCGSGTKKCGSKCVPLDANNGCADPLDCDACESFESCLGSPSKCGCVPDDGEACRGVQCGPRLNNCRQTVSCEDTCVAPLTCASNENLCVCNPGDPCGGVACGTVTDRCGTEVTCPNTCQAPTTACSGNSCVECNSPADCPDNEANPCARVTCTNHKCGVTTVAAGTPCPAGTCSTTVLGMCIRPVVTIGAYNMDATEVTRGQYQTFVKAKAGNTSGQAAVCSWNNDYTPNMNYPPTLKDYDMPVASIDWCDASAYCKWAGRRLCGKVGGGAIGYPDWSSAVASEWVKGCSGPSFYAFPYGSAYSETNCNTAPRSPGVRPVATYKMCEGGYPGLFDLSGNVAEFLDGCQGTSGAADTCVAIGGSASSYISEPPGESQKCASGDVRARNSMDPERGFRCCGP
jgi:hypothetical protein